MTETTRMTECTAPGATLYLAFELGSTKWVLAFTTSPAQRPRHRQVVAGDLRGVMREVLAAKVRFGVALDTPVRSCYEALQPMPAPRDYLRFRIPMCDSPGGLRIRHSPIPE